jgi:hypothetical protein
MKQHAVALIALLLPCLALAAPPAGLEQRIETVRAQVGVPGMSVAIVENDAVTFDYQDLDFRPASSIQH